METITLSGQIREGRGKGVCRKLRKQDRLPGVLYGSGDSCMFSVGLTVFKKLLSSGLSENIIFQFVIEGEDKKERNVLIRELQIHPVTRLPLHVDLYEVSMEKEIVVDVPIVLADEAVGAVEDGGILHHQLKTLSMECLPGLIPEHILVSVSELRIGDVIHVKDLKIDEGVKVMTDQDETVVSITGPAKEEVPVEEAPPEEAAAEEPQVEEPSPSEEGKG